MERGKTPHKRGHIVEGKNSGIRAREPGDRLLPLGEDPGVEGSLLIWGVEGGSQTQGHRKTL